MKRLPLVLLLGGLFLTACSEKPVEKKGAPPTLITTTTAKTQLLEVVETTLGSLEAVQDPKIGAEIAGRVIAVHVHPGQSVRKGQLLAEIDATDAGNQLRADQAEVARIESLLKQQERLLVRQTDLRNKNFISANALDDVTAQRDALKAQLETAKARAAVTGYGVGKSRAVAPFDGEVEKQIVTGGDYVKVGDPLLYMISNARLRAHLPFPETAAPRLKRGMPVYLRSPMLPGVTVNAVVEDIRPTVLEGSRALDLIARIDNPGGLRGNSSVDAGVVTGRKENAVLVPEQSVVLRPAGKVVYVIADGKARQQVVEAGSKQAGMIEIQSGLQGGEILALDGAGFLTNGAAVAVKEAPAKPAAAQAAK